MVKHLAPLERHQCQHPVKGTATPQQSKAVKNEEAAGRTACFQTAHFKPQLPEPSPTTRGSTTSFLTATTFAYAIGAGITAAAGTRLALQLILV